MTLVATLQSQSVKYDRDMFGASAVYHVYDDAGAQVSTQTIMASATISAILGDTGSALTSFGAYLAGTGTGTSAYRKLRYSGYDLKNDEGQYHWTMTVNFDSEQSDYSPTAVSKDTTPENAPGFTAVEMNIESVTVPTWRSGTYTMPSTDALRDDPNETDIGGTAVDQGGESIDAFVSIVRFTVRNVVRGRPAGSLFQNIANQTNTRNNAALTIGGFACPIGTLLFTGAEVSRCGPNAYEVTWHLAYDDDYHLRQVAKVDINGKPIVGVKSGGTISTVQATIDSADAAASEGHAPRYAAFVMWKQPFKSRTTFADIFPSGLTSSIA